MEKIGKEYNLNVIAHGKAADLMDKENFYDGYMKEVPETQITRKNDGTILEKDITTPGWRYFSSSIYYISTVKKSWIESRKDCRGRGADLVIINNSEEQVFVDVWRRNQGVWIGANDRDSEGTWKWVDGNKVINGFWNPGQPNSNGDEDCAVSGYHPVNGKWDDVSCNYNYIWICEKRLNM
ncbi:C-type lectin domain family 4 member M-like isoform X2 [Silurus asotus]|uniref:C-type lectin domain family 4 member M-like isoform X2 n=1 Tax=Silurus asotus TaxID=30991 RepID=A0AAD5FSF3_SILAS|nr:C-type lectin domain family 4 member M-like isoform X2 [Silurus asotus]